MPDRPNILLLVTDQERYDLTAADGVPVKTPHLDRLAETGTTFERAYTPTSICTSARASLLTGLYPHNHGMLNNSHEADAIQPNLPTSLPTVGTVLREAGYTNTYVGKWHVGRDQSPEDFGFSYFGGSDRFHDDLDDAYDGYRDELDVHVSVDALEETVRTDDGRVVSAVDPIPLVATRPYFIAQRTIDVLENLATDGEPFLHRTDFLGPHHPYIVPHPYASMYDADGIEPWDSYRETFDGKPTVHENYLAYRGVESFDWKRWSQLVAKYWGFMTLIDEQIGRILDALDDLGLTERTVVIHTSDHGDFVGNHRQFNKGPMMYEDTYRIPLHVRWPGVGETVARDEPVHLHDLMPTLIEIADAPIPTPIDGRSLVPLFQTDGPAEWPKDIFTEYHGDEFGLYSQRMIRSDRFKFVYNVPDRNELYDLQSDPSELQNLASHPEYRSVRSDLKSRLIELMRQTDDPLYRWSSRALCS